MNDLNVLQNTRARENTLLRSVYMWLFAGLLLTAGTSYIVSHSATMIRLLYSNMFVTMALAIAQVFIAINLSMKLERMTEKQAIGHFLFYSALTGVSLSSIFIVFAGTTIVKAFIGAASVFLGATIFSAFTKRDVRSWGNYLSMGLFGLIFVTFMNMFFRSSTMDLMISVVGVVLFTGLTAWDTKKILAMNDAFGSSMTKEEYTKIGIIGALEIYLDMINIFMYLLRIFANSDDQ